MRISIINGSPKASKSASESLINMLEGCFINQPDVLHYTASKTTDAEYAQILGSEAIILAFPLYIDAIPSNLFRLMVELERAATSSPPGGALVYAVANNGFYEGKQNRIALDIVKNWCAKAGFRYGQGVGVGSGGMIGALGGVPLGRGPLKNLGGAFRALASNIEQRKGSENLFINPNFPKFAYAFAATSGWKSLAKANGVSREGIKRRVGRD